MSFFERAWGSARTSIYILDIIPVQELFKVQPIDLVYPSDYYLFRDSAHAVRRSVHAYDVVPATDYAVASKVPVIYAYDIIQTYGSVYPSRGSVIHAYDVVQQSDLATKLGSIMLLTTDILIVLEWFSRINRALEIFEVYSPSELVVASAVPAVHVKDFIIYDSGSFRALKTASAYDYLARDYSTASAVGISVADHLGLDYGSYSKTKAVVASDYALVSDSASTSKTKSVSASDYIILDSTEYGKSYSPLFFTLFRRMIPVKHLTLSASERLVLDSAGYGRSYSPLLFTLLQRRVPIRYLALAVADVLGIADYAFKEIIAVPVGDHVITDSASAEGAVAVLAPDYDLLADALMLANRTVGAYDVIPIADYGVAVKAKVVSVFDAVLSDSVAPSKSYSPLLFTLLQRRIQVRYLTLSATDGMPILDSASIVRIKVAGVLDVVISDSASAAKRNVVSVADYIAYDYVPHVPPDEIRYRSLHANVGMRAVSVFDRVAPHESVWVGPRAAVVHARDYLVSDGASVLRRSVNAYDVLMRSNANIVRIT